ncbi:MAG: hypothetical protein AAF702_10645 [Chloroflexota bacterium]
MGLSKLTLSATMIFVSLFSISFLAVQAQSTDDSEVEVKDEVDVTDELDLKFAGALEFSDEGTLFVGDNYNGAIYAFEMDADDMDAQSASGDIAPFTIGDIDVRIASILGVGPQAVEINDMVVHPISQEIFISVSRIGGLASVPAIVKVTPDGGITLLDLASLSFTKQELAHYPDQETTFRPRGSMGDGPAPRDLAKGNVPLSSLAIMDMVYHEDELFVSGVAYDDFLSTLRRIPYPFDGTQTAASVEMYHIAHDQYETRAPIRAMSIQEIDGQDQLIAAYTCSPLVLVPLDEIVDGAKIAANTIADIGNGQPLDMIPFTLNDPFSNIYDQPMLFLTSNSRSPQVIPVGGLNGAQVVTDVDFERGPKLDLGPIIPFGPVGEPVMFDGAALHMALLGDDLFVSVTRDMWTGSLNLDANPTFFPSRLHNLHAEFDFPQYEFGGGGQ